MEFKDVLLPGYLWEVGNGSSKTRTVAVTASDCPSAALLQERLETYCGGKAEGSAALLKGKRAKWRFPTHKLFVLFASLAALVSVPFAAQTEGTVSQVDTAGMMITMEDGTQVKVGPSVDLASIMPGTKVKVMTDDTDTATSVQVLEE